MKKFTNIKTSVVILFLFIQCFSYAQQKTGNLVEYFGKEKPQSDPGQINEDVGDTGPFLLGPASTPLRIVGAASPEVILPDDRETKRLP